MTKYKTATNTLLPTTTSSVSADAAAALEALRKGADAGDSDSGTSFDWSNNSLWNRSDTGMTISPKGMGYGMGGLGALAGLMLPGNSTPWWQRLLYSLAGAGLLGGAGYVGGGLLGEGKGWTLPGGFGKLTPETQTEEATDDQ